MNERTYRDRARIVKYMNYLVVSMNNEDAYYEHWIHLVPDCADDEDFDEIAHDDELYGEVCKLFRELMGLYGADGFYAFMDEKAF